MPEVFHSGRAICRHRRLLTHILPVSFCTLFKHDCSFIAFADCRASLLCRFGRFLAFFSHVEDVHGAEDGRVEVRLISVDVAFHGGIYPALDPAKGGAEAVRQTVTDWVIKVIAENELVAGDILLQAKCIRDAVQVDGV